MPYKLNRWCFDQSVVPLSVRSGIVALLCSLIVIGITTHPAELAAQEASSGQPGQKSSTQPTAQPTAPAFKAAFPRPLESAVDSRYSYVNYCQSKVSRYVDSVMWGKRIDTLEWRPTDTLPSSVRDQARTCLARFRDDPVGRHAFGTLASLAIFAHDDDMIRMAIDSMILMQREAKFAGDSSNRLASLYFISLLRAAPARLDLARHMLVRNDYFNGASFGGDTSLLMTSSRVDMYVELGMFGAGTVNIPLLQEAQDSARKLVSRYQAVRMGKMSETEMLWAGAMEYRVMTVERHLKALRYNSDSVVDSYERELALISMAFPQARMLLGLSNVGKEAPVVQTPFSFLRGIKSVPEPGRAMVVVIGGEECEATCATRLNRLRERIGNVPVVLIAEVYGNVRNGFPGTHEENAEALRAHLQDSLHLNVSLVVDTAPRYVTSAPDSRYLYGRSPTRLQYTSTDPVFIFGVGVPRSAADGFLVIDRKGRVVWQASFDLHMERFLFEYIRRVAEEEE